MFFSTIVSVSLAAVLVSSAPIGRDIHAWMEMERRAGADDASLSQGLNSFFSTLNIQSPCTVGQKACVNGRIATCSIEGNFEVQQSCPTDQKCLAAPGSPGTIFIGCTDEQSALQAILAAGGTGGVSVDKGITAIPDNIQVVTAMPSATETATTTSTTATSTGTETSTATSTETPPPTCLPDDGGDDDETTSIPTFEATLGDPLPTTLTAASTSATDATCTVDPTETDTEELPNPTETVDPTATCTEEDPEETEEPVSTLTLILVPNPTAPGEFLTSTFTPTETATATATETTTTETSATDATVTFETSSTSAVVLPALPGSTTSITGAIPSPTGDINVIGTGFVPATSSTAVPDIIALPVGSIPAKRDINVIGTSFLNERQLAAQPGTGGSNGAPVGATPLIDAAKKAQGINSLLAANPNAVSVGAPCALEGAPQCVSGSLGRCTNGVWEIDAACPETTQCLWIPTESAGVDNQCLSYDAAWEIFNDAGLDNGPFA